MQVQVHTAEQAKEKGVRYILEVHLQSRTDSSKYVPSVWWETYSQAEAHEMLLLMLDVYNADGQENFVSFATIETAKGKQVFARNLSHLFTRK